MPAIDSFRSVISLWASPEAMAVDIGAGAAAVRKWSQRDRIPDEWWSSILGTMTAKLAGLNAETLVELAKRDAAPASDPAEARA
jgi:hypothetical protein